MICDFSQTEFNQNIDCFMDTPLCYALELTLFYCDKYLLDYVLDIVNKVGECTIFGSSNQQNIEISIVDECEYVLV